MKLAGLHVQNYGVLQDFTLERECFCGAPMIIYGPNEAGKSTLMSFIRGILFGFKGEGRKPVPVDGAAPGGWIYLEDSAGQVFRVQRSGKRGKLVVELPGGEKEGEGYLKNNLLGGVSPVLFKNVFSVGIDELRKMEDLKKEEVSAHIYGAGTGINPDRLARAASYLQNGARDLYNPRGRKQVINQLLDNIKETERKIRQLEREPARYRELKEDLSGLEEKQKNLNRRQKELQQRKKQLESLLNARGPWLKMQNTRARLDDIQAKSTAAGNEIESQRAAIKALGSEKNLFLEKKQKISEEEARLEQLEAQVKEQLADLGPGWDEEKVLPLDLFLALYRQVEGYEEKFSKCRENINQAEQHVKYCSRDAAACKKDLGDIDKKLDAFAAKGDISLQEKESALEELNGILQERERLQTVLHGDRQRSDDLNSRKEFIERSLEDLQNSRKPAWTCLFFAAVGGAAFYVLGFNPAGFISFAGGAVLALVLGLRCKKWNDAVSARQEQVREERKKISREQEQLEHAVGNKEEDLNNIEYRKQELTCKLDFSPGFTREELNHARRELEREKRKQLEKEQLENQKEKTRKVLEQLQNELKCAGEKQEECMEELNQLNSEWQNFCREKGLPQLGPRDMTAFLNLAGKARETINKMKLCREEKSRLEEYVNNYVQRLNSTAAALQKETTGIENAGELAAVLEKLVEEHDEVMNTQKQLQDWLEETREHLLSIAGGAGALDKLLAELDQTSREENNEEMDDINEELKKSGEHLEQLNKDIAEKNVELRELENSEELSRARQQKVVLEEQLAYSVRQWRVYTLCSALLSAARQKYERERQPSVLKKASLYIEPVTGGRYNRVITPVGAPDQLEVEQPAGERVKAGDLSRGAANQLYLSLRLSLARHYSSTVWPLPVMLDDVMVDFDPGRLAGAVNILKKITPHHQVLFFTCHKHVLDLIAEVIPEYTCVSL
ncbi:MAG: AAA family ATPase [Clostridiales bacterium]|nr:AAA family ATPase [Clostridiales bacterium]MCF8023096.1 AAA family ATPase [Clostridiales bacterium]